MLLRHRLAPVAVGAVALAGVVGMAAPAGAATRVLRTTLTGGNEVPGPGDADASGTAQIIVNTKTGRICWVIRVRHIPLPATAAHIHEAPAGVAGPVVVPLSPPGANGVSTGCVTNAAEAAGIAANPSHYYVNVHSTEFPGGAARGQL